MVEKMIAIVWKEAQVFFSVIFPVSVYVVNSFGPQKRAPEFFFHD